MLRPPLVLVVLATGTLVCLWALISVLQHPSPGWQAPALTFLIVLQLAIAARHHHRWR